MIKHILDSVGMTFSRIDPIKKIPRHLSDQLYIDHAISDIDANVIVTSKIFNVSLVLLYEDIGDYNSNTVFVTETYDVLPSGSDSGDLSRHAKMHRYIFIPDIIKLDSTKLRVTSSIIYNVIEDITSDIKYKYDRSKTSVDSLPLLLTTYLMCEYGYSPSPTNVLRELTDLKDGSTRLIDISDVVDNVLISTIQSATDVFDGDKINIVRDKTCKKIIL